MTTEVIERLAEAYKAEVKKMKAESKPEVKSETKPEPKPKVTKPAETKNAFIQGFVDGTLGKKTKLGTLSVVIEDGIESLIYTGYHSVFNRETRETTKEIEGKDVLAIKLPSGVILSNSSSMEYAGSHMCWGYRNPDRGQSKEQAFLESLGVSPVPFGVFKEANLNILHAKVIEKAPSETVKIEETNWDHVKQKQVTKTISRHYTGACLLEVDGAYFLFDIDREELKHKIFNPFLVKLVGKADTIADAYQSLIPVKVTVAMTEGLPVQRQGEWFFIKRFDKTGFTPQGIPKEMVDNLLVAPHIKDFGGTAQGEYHAGNHSWNGTMTFKPKSKELAYGNAVDAWEAQKEVLEQYEPRQGNLTHGTSRPNTVEKLVRSHGMVLCTGKVSHTGREHRDLHLVGWWEAVGNTAIGAWQVSGDID